MALDATICHPLPPSLFPATFSSANDLLHKADTDKKGPIHRDVRPAWLPIQTPGFYHMGLHGSCIPFAWELFLKVTLDITRTAQIEAETDFRSSLSMRLMKEVALPLETLCMV